MITIFFYLTVIMNSIYFTLSFLLTFAPKVYYMEHRIKELIKEKGYTHQEFADKLGISRIGLSQLINGKPSYPTLEKIATALDVPMWQLFASPGEVVKEITGGDRCPYCGGAIRIRIDKLE